MFIEFKVANYRSIRAEQTLSMVASNYSDELPQNLISCDHVPGLKGTKLVKAVALYGANASGKSNIVAALRFFAEFVRDSATKLQPGAPTGAQPFKLDPACLTEPSKFEITAVINGIRTLYGIEMTRERVTSEYLVAYPKRRPQVWFERDWDEGKGEYKWSKPTMHFKHDAALREKTRETAAFLSTGAQFEQKESKRVAGWIEQIDAVSRISTYVGKNAAARIAFVDDRLRDRLTVLLKAADLGVSDLRFRKADQIESAMSLLRTVMSNPNSALYTAAVATGDIVTLKTPPPPLKRLKDLNLDDQVPELLHAGRTGTGMLMNFASEESLGTQRLLELAGEVFVASSLGKIQLVDEIEASLHPILVSKVIRQFFEMNDDLDAQLLFTTHNPLLLDQTLLRRDQIWFTEKDQEGATRLYPLTDFKPRKDESLVKGYLAGRYGGIPFIPEGLKF